MVKKKSTIAKADTEKGSSSKGTDVEKKGDDIDLAFDRLRSKGLPECYLNEVRAVLEKQNFDKVELDYFIKEIYTSYMRAKVFPGEPVGTVAAQSIGEPGTQMSLAPEEKVVVRFGNNDLGIVEIGKFIDLLFSKSGMEKKNSLFATNTDILDIPRAMNLFVPSVGNDEKIHWGRVTQVSRHKANLSCYLIKIKTRSGREIIATSSHSFLIRSNNDIGMIKGKDLKIQDRIPVISKMPIDSIKNYINLSDYLPKDQFWYGSELHKIISVIDTYGREWKYNIDENSIPVSIDRIYQINRDRPNELRKFGKDYVYSKNPHNLDLKIPEKFPLDEETAWFFGIYLAEGHNTGYTTSIANVNPEIQNRIINFAKRFSINYNIKKGIGVFGPSDSSELYSTVLSSLFTSLFGDSAFTKTIPPCIFTAPEGVIASLIRGYFDGDGNYNASKKLIRAGTRSKELRDRICLLLSRLGIFTTKYEETTIDLKKFYNFSVPAHLASKWYQIIGSDIPKKLNELEKIIVNKSEAIQEKTYDVIDMIPGIGSLLNDLRMESRIDSHGSTAASIRKITKKNLIGRQTLGRYIDLFENEAPKTPNTRNALNTLRKAYTSEVIWDEITSIENVLDFPFVYDFSVDYYENFLTADGIFTHNTLRTFHYAGVSEFSVTKGLPRLIEIVDARRNPSTPLMNIYLNEEFKKTADKAKMVHQQIEQIKFETISDEIDVDLTEYTLNIYLNPELMDDKGITMDDVLKKLKKFKKKGDVDYNEEENVVIINPDTDDVQKLQKIKEKINKTLIRGVRGIKRGMIKKEQNKKSGEEEWLIQTEGTNFVDVCRIEGVDTYRTASNHIHEIEKNLGIEAARELIIREAADVLRDQSLDVDIRHLNCMADLMCSSGSIQQIGRHGISGTKESVLARAAFEVTIKQLIQASIAGEEEKLMGIPENVIVGQLVPTIGTGSIDLMMDFSESAKLLLKRETTSK